MAEPRILRCQRHRRARFERLERFRSTGAVSGWGFTRYMAIYAPMGVAFLFVYILFGRVVVPYFMISAETDNPSLGSVDARSLASSTVSYEASPECPLVEVAPTAITVEGVVACRPAAPGGFSIVECPSIREVLTERLSALAKEVRSECEELGREFDGVLSVAPHADTPYGVLFAISQAARAAGFDDLQIAVRRGDRL